MRQSLLRSLIAILSILPVSTSLAAVISISAATFVPRDLSGSPTLNGETFQGLLLNAKGQYYAPVVFPSAGNVCRFTLVFRDNDAEQNVTARLRKKGFAAGGNAFSVPVIMAAVTSAAASNTTRVVSDTTIVQRAVFLGAFYYVELVVPIQSLEVLGVLIDFRTTACP